MERLAYFVGEEYMDRGNWAEQMDYEDALADMKALEARMAELEREIYLDAAPRGDSHGDWIEGLRPPGLCPVVMAERFATLLTTAHSTVVQFEHAKGQIYAKAARTVIVHCEIEARAEIDLENRAFWARARIERVTSLELLAGVVDPIKRQAAPHESVKLYMRGDVWVCDDKTLVQVPLTQLQDEAEFLLKSSENMIAKHKQVVQRIENESAPRGLPAVIHESEMPSSVQVVPGANTGAVTCIGECEDSVVDWEYKVRGCMVYQQNDNLAFLTHRHGVSFSGVLDMPYMNGWHVAVALMKNNTLCGNLSDLNYLRGRVTAVVSPHGMDVMWVLTDIRVQGIPPFKTADKSLKAGEILNMYTFRAYGPTFEWQHSTGKVVTVKKDYVTYDMTTVNGNCGHPAYTRDGRIASMHLYGNQMAAGRKVNAGWVVRRLPKPLTKNTRDVPDYEIPDAPLSVQGVVEERGRIEFVKDPKYATNSENTKIWGLRGDVDLRGLLPEYYYAKCSTACAEEELRGFADKLKFTMRKTEFARAAASAVLYDMQDPITVPFAAPTMELCIRTLEVMDGQRNAGLTGEKRIAKDYILKLGNGDEIEGRRVVAARTMKLYEEMCLEDGGDQEILSEVRHWAVMQKKDGYKEKKLPPLGNGRTIQAPSLELKLLWLVVFGESDDAWLSRGGNGAGTSWVHQGDDDDLPCHYEILRVLKNSLGAFAGDMTSFDRHTPASMIQAFFMMYLPMVCRGVPRTFLAWMADVTINSWLVLPNGKKFQKSRGNPSGFMNTLRLNCFVHLLSLMYVVHRRTVCETPADAVEFVRDHLHVQMCGDDSRIFAMDEDGLDFLDLRRGAKEYMAIWERELPWHVKVEGLCLFDEDDTIVGRCEKAPPMVGRRFIWVDDILFEPLYNISRCCRRLTCNETRDPEIETALREAIFVTCALPVYWQRRRDPVYYSPVIEMLCREFWGERTKALVYQRAGDMYAQSRDRQGEPADPAKKQRIRA